MIRHLAGLGLAVGLTSGLAAQQPPRPLSFQGLRPGMTRLAADSVITSHGGSLRCQPTRESRLGACSARLPNAGHLLSVTVSLVDDRIGIALVTGRLPAEQIADWHADLVERFGARHPERRPGQESFQWISEGQMLRLTVRREAGGLTASVSLLDGPLLDGLPPP